MSGATPRRVLICDDSPLSRAFLGSVLRGQPGVEIVGTAADGRAALSKIEELQPDVLVLDLEMPVMGGLETLRRVRASFPRVGVVMFSSHCRRGAQATISALAAGAHGSIPKPVCTRGRDPIAEVRAALLAKIEAICATREPLPANRQVLQIDEFRPRAIVPIEVIAIGASTGGAQALHTLFASWTRPLPVPIVVVQHMLPLFTEVLASRLDRLGPTRVVEADHGLRLEAGHAYIAPGGRHLGVAGTPPRLCLSDGDPEEGRTPGVDRLFQSVEQTYGAGTLVAVLTGMGQDGTEGARAVRRRGGTVLVQDEASSVVWGMPRSVQAAGLAHDAVPISELGAELSRRVAVSRLEWTRFRGAEGR